MQSTTTDPGYRWVIVFVSTVILAIAMGQIVNGLSVYFVPLEAAQGWGRGEIALINSSGLVGVALGSLVMGFAADAYGIRPVAILGILATGLGTLTASRASELWQLYGIFFFVGMIGGGSLSGPLMACVGGWFTKGAGVAIGLVAAGTALGQGGMPFTGAFLIEAFGWRDAMFTQAMVTLVLLLPLALFLRNPPAPPGQAALSDETPSGLPNGLVTGWLAIAALFCCSCMSVPLMHLVPLIQGQGHTAPEAGGVLFWMLMVAITGRVAFGKLADMIGAVPTWIVASGWQTVMVLGFLGLSRLDHFYFYATIYGFGYAGVMTAIFVSVRTLTAPARRASSMGIVLAFAYLGHGLGGWQGGYFFDQTSAYGWSYANAALAGLVNLAILGSLLLTLRARRILRPA